MNSAFDRLKKTVFNVVQRTMGDVAIWFLNGDLNGPSISAKVLFNNHTEGDSVGRFVYDNDNTTIEFKVYDFPGLKEQVEDKDDALIFVNGEFYCIHQIVAPKNSAKDGDTFVAILNISDEHRELGKRDMR